MKALKLKREFIKQGAMARVGVVGHLSAVVEGEEDCYYHIHDDEEIPENVGVSFHIFPQYSDHWRDNTPIEEK